MRRGRILAALGVLVVLLIVPQYVRAYRIHGPSDAPNYLWGDLILVHRAAYDLRLPFSRVRLARLGTPRRGDAVVLRLPDAEYDVTRRVIGIPGDTVEVRESRVILNGRALEYEPVGAPVAGTTDPRNRIGSVIEREHGAGLQHLITYTPGECGVASAAAVTVPDAHYYVLGDNRDHCTDSRRLGPIPHAWVVGRIVGTLWSGRGRSRSAR